MKADKLKNKIEMTKAKIASNNSMKQTFNSGIDSIDKTIKEKGKAYIEKPQITVRQFNSEKEYMDYYRSKGRKIVSY